MSKLCNTISELLEAIRVSASLDIKWKNNKLEIYKGKNLLVAFSEKDAKSLRDFINKNLNIK